MTNVSNTFDFQHEERELSGKSFRWPVIFIFLFLGAFAPHSWGATQAGTLSAIGISDEQLATDREWVLSQPPKNYTIQFLAALKPHTVGNIIADYQLKGPIRIIGTHYNNRDWTVIIKGSYPSYREALNVLKQLPQRLQQVEPAIWIRNFASLHEIIIRPVVVAPEPIPEPLIYGFDATATTITVGDSTALAADFANGTSFIDNGIGAIASGAFINVAPTATTTYTLTVTNEAGMAVSQSVNVTVVEPEPEPEPVAVITMDEVDPAMYEGVNRSLRGPEAIEWIMSKNPKHYTVHLYTTDSLRDMEKFVAGNELPEDSAFYNVKYDGVMNYVLIYGDFEKRRKARASVKKLEKGLRRGKVKARKFRYPQKELDDAQY